MISNDLVLPTVAVGRFATEPRLQTRSRARGTFDMVGNVAEWVADWAPVSTMCPSWASFSDDFMCLAGASTTRNGPGTLQRGGWFLGGAVDGPLTVLASLQPSRATDFVGFRCAR